MKVKLTGWTEYLLSAEQLEKDKCLLKFRADHEGPLGGLHSTFTHASTISTVSLGFSHLKNYVWQIYSHRLHMGCFWVAIGYMCLPKNRYFLFRWKGRLIIQPSKPKSCWSNTAWEAVTAGFSVALKQDWPSWWVSSHVQIPTCVLVTRRLAGNQTLPYHRLDRQHDLVVFHD